MYFCPECSYILDISKISNTTKENNIKKIIDKPNDLFKLLENNEDLTQYSTLFTKEELILNKKYKKLSANDKNKIYQLYNSNIITSAEFNCPNCNYSKEITETTLLYQIDIIDKTTINIKSLDENKLITSNQLLINTKDYTCKNTECKTHTDNSLKESVMYKDRNNYCINYICKSCFFSWSSSNTF